MELRTFAEKVLFSTRLEDKLAAPESQITDESPGGAISSPAAPGRPGILRFSKENGNDSFARARHLQSDEDRATLLHFFANHELLATELMALVLLKFPDAPKEFRSGILQTLREEQAHTQMYLRRMTACGLAFGDRPVNGFFWKNIADMETPLDYVTRLSLTFEQANLDFAHHFSQVFRAGGDSSTATILDKIYRDEITHVSYGLKWFRQWKGEGLTDWQAFQNQLQFPLSPTRAKGKAPFNADGRRATGLDEEFIRELQVSTSSRGRTPHVYFFNPTAEESVARQSARFTPSAEFTTLARDLETIALFLAREDDLVLLRRRPSTEFLQKIQCAGLPVPEIEILDASGKIAADSPNKLRKMGVLRPWGWSPDSVHLLEPFAKNVTKPGPGTQWIAEIAELYSKEWSARLLQNLLIAEPALPLTAADDCSRTANDLSFVTTCAEEFLQRHTWVVLKSAFGVSGRGMLRVTSETLHEEKTQGWIRNTLKRHHAIIVEPWFDRVFDFSMQYEVTRSNTCSITFKGGTQLINDARGQFKGCKASHQFISGLPPEVARFFNMHATRRTWARDLFRRVLPEMLVESLRSTEFEGPLGVDAFVYRESGGTLPLRLQPIVEINPRFTFGRLAVDLCRSLNPGSHGTLEIVPATEAPVNPTIVTASHGEHVKICSGTLPLSEPMADSRFAAVWRVES
ncbi:MAG: uncharacterized ferritin-like protein (DUF455 family) [Verrucomicrobiales bacterium]|jgi:uncharacterized ferritin-like protein (DUF455 family)